MGRRTIPVHRVMAPIIALVVAMSVLGGGRIARADDDPVAERATITYRLDRKHERVLVTARYRWTNQIPSTALRRYYLDQWGPIGIPSYARAFKVQGRGVRAQRTPTGGTFDNVIVSFPRIYNGQTVSVTATWTLPSRSADSSADVRVTDAYSYFCWTGQPVDSGSVTVIVPAALEAVTRGSTVRESRKGNTRRISARQTGDLASVYACTDLYDPRLLVHREVVSPGGQPVTVDGWPGDPAWLEEATSSVELALAGLESVVGAPLPDERPVRVREVAANALMGYGGEFDPGSGIIRVGEGGASARLLAHELAHTWFNSRTVNANWLWEGLAEWTAREAAGDPCQAPSEYPAKGKPRLRTWRIASLGASLEDQAMVEYQYFAACSIMEQASEAMGPEAMREVLGVLLDGDSPYDRLPFAAEAVPPPATPPSSPEASPPASGSPTPAPSPSPEASPAPSSGSQHIGPQPRQSALPSAGPTATPTPSATPLPSSQPAPSAQPSTTATRLSTTPSQGRRTKPVDWRQWLDIVDEVGLVPTGAPDQDLAERLLIKYGIAKRSQLDGRAEARAAFHDLRDMAPDGVTPAVVRRLMDEWEFKDARAMIRLARGIAARLATLPPDDSDRADLWARYEAAASRRALERLERTIQ